MPLRLAWEFALGCNAGLTVPGLCMSMFAVRQKLACHCHEQTVSAVVTMAAAVAVHSPLSALPKSAVCYEEMVRHVMVTMAPSLLQLQSLRQ